MSFRKSAAGMQTSLLGYYSQLPESKREKMENSAEAAFHGLVVARIDEEPFGVLYCPDNGAPNKPIRQLVGATVLMHRKGWTTRELFDHIDFDLLTMRALGIAEVGESPFCRATFFNFQNRLADHYVRTGQNLLEPAFDHLTAQQMKQLGITGRIQRCDSFQALSNIVAYTRVRLLVEVLIRLSRVLKEEDRERLAELLGPYTKQDSGHYVYELDRSQLPTELEKLGEVYLALHEALKDDYAGTEIFGIFERTFNEQFALPEAEDRVEVRPPEDIPSDSLQSPDDPTATYREKDGEQYRGQVVSVTETADPEEAANLITDVTVASNNTDDSEILEGRVEPITEKTPDLEEFHTDGGFGNEQSDLKLEEAGVRHVTTAVRGREKEVPIQIEQDGETYRVSCPLQSVQARRAQKRWKAPFDLQLCRDCPHAGSCPTVELKSSRTFYFSHADYLANRRRNALREIPPERRKIRPNIEATVKEFYKPLNHKGKLPYTGRLRTELYAFSMAIAINFGREWRCRRDKEAQEQRCGSDSGTCSENSSTTNPHRSPVHTHALQLIITLILYRLISQPRRMLNRFAER